MRRLVWLVGLAALTWAAPMHAQRLVGVCAGDCNLSCTVETSEVGTVVSSALGASGQACESGDFDGDGEMTIEDLVATVSAANRGCPGTPCHSRTVEISPSDNDYENLLMATIDAQPGDVIFLRAGTYNITGQLSIDVDDVTVRGEGIDQTILSFANQSGGGEGLKVTGDRFVIEDIALVNGPGDLLKAIGVQGLTIRRTRTEWTNGPSTENGAYGLYPVDCRNILIEDSIVRGAADAGFYVGQSHGIVMRRNLAEFNVAGIEIENSTDADVYDNIATKNTGGILVFNLPGLLFIDGRRTRVFHNEVFENNTENFAAGGTTVSAVPKGTGIMILANDEVEVFDNTLRDNDTTHILIISFRTAQLVGDFVNTDPNYDLYSETVFIHDNHYIGGGTDPEQSVAELLATKVGPPPLPQILFDGFVNRAKLMGGQLPDHLRLCIQETGATFSNIHLDNLAALGDPSLEPFDCTHPNLPAVQLPGVALPPEPTATPTQPQATPTPTVTGAQEARCRVPPGTGVNLDPSDRSCQLLSSYRFFTGDMAQQEPNDGVVPYDLNTPLFSDYASKKRFVYLPPGSKAQYSANESFDFPVGSVLIKTFIYPADLRDPSGPGEILETRLLVRGANGWSGIPYVWNAQKTDAVLNVLGPELPVSGLQQNGEFGSFTHNVPNSNECKECHKEHNDTMGVLGPKARHLNKLYSYPEGSENQLTHWTRIGILNGAPADPSMAQRAAVFDDPSTGSVELRARSYLDANCAHCHNPTGPARTTGFFLHFDETEAYRLGICKSPTAAGHGTGGLPYVINPGDPVSSIVPFRMRSVEPEIAMPELGRTRVHVEAIEVIDQWIASLPGNCDEF